MIYPTIQSSAVTTGVVGAVVGAYLATFVAVVLIVRASLALGASLVRRKGRKELLVLMTRAVLPGGTWRELVDPDCLAAVETYRRRMWIALVLMGSPLYLVGVAYVL